MVREKTGVEKPLNCWYMNFTPFDYIIYHIAYQMIYYKDLFYNSLSFFVDYCWQKILKMWFIKNSSTCGSFVNNPTTKNFCNGKSAVTRLYMDIPVEWGVYI